jgi:hypothetical protein
MIPALQEQKAFLFSSEVEIDTFQAHCPRLPGQEWKGPSHPIFWVEGPIGCPAANSRLQYHGFDPIPILRFVLILQDARFWPYKFVENDRVVAALHEKTPLVN